MQVQYQVLNQYIRTFSYFSFSLAALASYGALSLGLCVDHSSPSFFAMSPIDMPGLSSLILGRWSEQNTKKAELGGEGKITTRTCENIQVSAL